MEKRKRWHLVLLLSVIALTVYNIAPSIFFYAKPLDKPIDQKQATEVASSIMTRVNDLEKFSINWVQSFSKLLGLKPTNIELNNETPELIKVSFSNEKDAQTFRSNLPAAGALIPFIPAQLSSGDSSLDSTHLKVVNIQRKIPVHFSSNDLDKYFTYIKKFDSNGMPTEAYQKLLNDRILEMGLAISGESENAGYLKAIINNPNDSRSQDFTLLLAQNILNTAKIFGESSSLSKRFYHTFTQGDFSSPKGAIDELINTIDHMKDRLRLQRIQIQEEEKRLSDEGSFLDAMKKERLELTLSQEERLTAAGSILKREQAAFISTRGAMTYQELKEKIATKGSPLILSGTNPLIEEISLNIEQNSFNLILQKDIALLRASLAKKPGQSYLLTSLDQLIYNEIARLNRITGESIKPNKENFTVALSDLNGSESLLALNLKTLAKAESQNLKKLIETTWQPKHPELQEEAFPLYENETYQKLTPSEQRLGLVIYTPSTYDEMPPKGFKTDSIYVIAKGAQKILNKYQQDPHSEGALAFRKDFEALRTLLRKKGFIAYSGDTYPLSAKYQNDVIFQSENYYNNLIDASRENFTTTGSKRFATLEFTNFEQRIYALNKIEDSAHEDLLKWRNEYEKAKVSTTENTQNLIPKPTKNVLLNNLALSFRKYFRGDERKILHWGLDLSGGKTVQIELRDQNGQAVKDEASLDQGINELYRRVNKMGVSEVTIRREGSHISLDFPGAQGLSAEELIRASSMQFHVVNEKFSNKNHNLAQVTNRFLEEIWNEAVVTGKKDIKSLNAIAFTHLYGEVGDGVTGGPRSESAKILYESGLRLRPPSEPYQTVAFNDVLSKIAQYRGDSPSEWENQTHPLLVVFNNYALEGSSLENIQGGYDPSRGNYLSFQVIGSTSQTDGTKTNPRQDLYNWTSIYSKEAVTDSPLSEYSNGSGWRMAAILNGTVISTPNLSEPLRKSAMITGSFSQAEINKLEADLKAGSLTYTPIVLSEKNVSPELGQKERTQGLVATGIALLLVIGIMISYYRFAGVIASVAVLLNLLIMWAALQNIQASLTLAGLAGMILVIGMAVDANVLVFERIREEFKAGKRLAQAVSAGYRKAFSAIADSNITTIIAALILLNFDSGPIKGFAVTLIIGIVSSMFTALFMTRFFFARWVQKPERKELKMNEFFKSTSKFNFIKNSRFVITASVAIALIGSFLLFKEKQNLFGMDFTGGYSMQIELEQNAKTDYRQQVQQALVKAGAPSTDFDVRQLNPKNQLRLFFGTNMDAKGKPFYGMPIESRKDQLIYPFEANPRIAWVVDALVSENIMIKPESLAHLEQTWTNISGQMSTSMRNSAIIGLSLALLAILAYITLRFEFKYALSATICLAHDVIITLGMVAILNALKLPITIDLKTIAALMTIVGYSLNDTIIIFDRIREDLNHKKKCSFKDVVNNALNRTLSRTVMTSLTTLVVLLALVLMGGASIFGFALVMTIGVIFGTLSSLFIASPILLYLEKKETAKEKSMTLSHKK
ncbi:MAG: protein translocase subunit SecD [Simkaniaceae bacterium]